MKPPHFMDGPTVVSAEERADAVSQDAWKDGDTVCARSGPKTGTFCTRHRGHTGRCVSTGDRNEFYEVWTAAPASN